jgi:hypothetical protein
MSLATESSLRGLNDCGCCEGLSVATPAQVTNRPGLSTIAYRVGTHAQFKRSMLARLSGIQPQALLNLTTREDDDFSIALLDAWATVADVLTFYQERIANESYLRTATERFSLLQLGRLIGYELRPGVAASTYLAFTLDDVAGAPDRTAIGAGAKVSSVPGQGSKPQTFETVEQIEARVEWNALRPKTTQARVPQRGDTQIHLQGISTNLKPGDALLFVGAERESKATSDQWEFRRVAAVALEPGANRTRVEWASDQPLKDLSTNPTIYALRQRASLFGYNAPHPKSLSNETLAHYKVSSVSPPDWTFTIDTQANHSIIDLDSAYPAILSRSWLVVVAPRILELHKTTGILELHKTTEVVEAARADFVLTGKTTRISLADKVKDEATLLKGYRQATVFAQSEELRIAETPITDPVRGAAILLAAASPSVVDARPPYSDLRNGQRLAASGKDSSTGEPIGEVVVVHDLSGGLLTLDPPLLHGYARDSFSLNANVAAATHGETVQEVLGSGDASQPYQRFSLRQPPLTYTSSPTPSGGSSTLQLGVNDLLWHEVPALFGRGPRERVYITRTEDDGKTAIQFGDGQNGARLPTGQENISAVYRRGIGQEGLLDAGQLSTLLTRPPGVKSVTNPLRTTGGQDRESVTEARRNMTLTELTLDRLVSLQDYEDFARAFAGIAKALATSVWTGQARGVFLTVAGPASVAVEENSALHDNLLAAMREGGDPRVMVRVASYRKASFQIAATLKCDPDHEPDKVLGAVRDALRSAFSFDARQFGQPVALSEVITTMQSVDGVVAVDVDELSRTDGIGGGGLQQLLPAAGPQVGAQGEVLAAELLLLDPNSLTKVVVTS